MADHQDEAEEPPGPEHVKAPSSAWTNSSSAQHQAHAQKFEAGIPRPVHPK